MLRAISSVGSLGLCFGAGVMRDVRRVRTRVFAPRCAPIIAVRIAAATACATGGGKALPICRYAAVFFPEKVQLSGNP